MTKSGKPRGATPEEREKPQQDFSDPRTKSQKHGKTTADKWNQ